MSKDRCRNSRVLLIGGAGYIGSHMLRHLLAKKIVPVVFDNLSSGFRSFVPPEVPFFRGDLKDSRDIAGVFNEFNIEKVMHFASSIIVPESVSDPLKYYENNVVSFVHLLKQMKKARVNKIIFSSTAAVYAQARKIPIREESPLRPGNPYGKTKLICEQILQDASKADKDFSFVIFRYFNVGGAYQKGGIGQSHQPETHLIPIVLQTALGLREFLQIYGDDYPTPDGTCIRDYIHVDDLCDAHFLALQSIDTKARNQIFNLGSQKGFSVKEVVDEVQKLTGQRLAVKISARRAGDMAKLIADSTKAKKILGWVAKRGLSQIITSAWQWERFRLKNKI